MKTPLLRPPVLRGGADTLPVTTFFLNKTDLLARVIFGGLWPAGEGVTHQELADIYERHRRALFALALSITRCQARAEDAVHDAFARLCRISGRVAGDRIAYVFSAVRNAAVDQIRRGAIERDVRRAQDVLFDLDGFDPRQQALDAERDRSMAAAVEALPADQREVVVLRIFAGLRFAQIAQIIGAPLPTVTTRYRRAMQRLRLKLESMT